MVLFSEGGSVCAGESDGDAASDSACSAGQDDEDVDDVGRCGDASDNDANGEEDFTDESDRFSRRGAKLYWDGKNIGRITGWRGSTSCHCSFPGHSGCKSQAATIWPSDKVLVNDWLLFGLQQDLSKVEHVDWARRSLNITGEFVSW